MSGAVKWNDIGKNSKMGSDGEGKQIEFLRLSGGNAYRVRPLGSPVVFFKYVIQHEGEWRWAICEDPDTCPARKKHNVEPRERYAINILDRADGKIKVMEGPVTVFKSFRTYFENTNNSPGGPDGADFIINVKGSGLKTRYDVNADKRTPFTDAEKEYIRNEGLYKLDRIFKATPEDEIEDVLFGSSTKDEEKPEPQPVAASNEESGDDLPW